MTQTDERLKNLCLFHAFQFVHVKDVARKLTVARTLRIGESPSICPFLKNNYFSGMDKYSDFLLLKIHLNIQVCIMTSLHRLT